MIQLYTFTTPNGIKPIILLEELGLPYQIHWVDIGKGEQHEAAFFRINPNAKIPALVDDPAPRRTTRTLAKAASLMLTHVARIRHPQGAAARFNRKGM